MSYCQSDHVCKLLTKKGTYYFSILNGPPVVLSVLSLFLRLPVSRPSSGGTAKDKVLRWGTVGTWPERLFLFAQVCRCRVKVERVSGARYFTKVEGLLEWIYLQDSCLEGRQLVLQKEMVPMVPECILEVTDSKFSSIILKTIFCYEL